MKTQYLDLTTVQQHLNEVLEDLPQNCIFNKIICGAGGTHLALTNNIPYIIIVPYKDLIISKVKQSIDPKTIHLYTHKIQPIYQGIEIEDINKAKEDGCIKFMATYHGLSKIIKAFGDEIGNYQLLVDEAHMLTEGDDKDFMHDEINYILQSYHLFKSVCFMTATPYDEECMPEQITSLPLVIGQWSNIDVTNLIAQKIEGKFNDYICQIALEHMDGRKQGDPFFFYNSVEAITTVCKKLIESGICLPSDIRVIAADKNNSYIKKYGHKDLFIEDTYACSENPKRINFITAKAFEGCDIYQKSGVTYICADGQKRHTRLEIHTKIPQIVNRIRDSNFKKEAYLLYTQSFIKDCRTKEEFVALIKDGMIKVEKSLIQLDTLDENTKKYLDKDMLESDEFMTKDLQGKYIVNKNAGKRALSQWASANQLFYYQSNNKEHITNIESKSKLIDIINNPNPIEFFKVPSGTDKIKLGGKVANFKKLCLDYIKATEENDAETVKFIHSFNSVFSEARKVFKGNVLEEITASSMQETKLQKRIDSVKSFQLKQNTIVSVLPFKEGMFYKTVDIKIKLQKLYESLDIKKVAKATDLQQWYTIKSTSKNGHNGFNIIGKYI